MAEAVKFADYDLKLAIEALGKVVTDTIKLNRQYIDGEHWQSAAGWIGPRPQPDEEGFNEVMAILKAGFTSSNKILEVCERHADGVIGREPRFSLVPLIPLGEEDEIPEGDQTKIDEAELWLTRWWNQRGIHLGLLQAVSTLMWAERSVLRLYIPPAFLGTDGSVNFETIEDALMAIYLDTPAPENATVIVDPLTKDELGIFTYKNAEDKDEAELVFLKEATGNPNDPRETVIRVITQEGSDDSSGLLFGNRITMYEMTRARFITEQIRQNQRALNLALTNIPRNVTSAGFLARMLLNAQMPGYWKLDENGQRTEFIQGKFKMGAGTTNIIVGLEQIDAQGNKTYTNPQVHETQPVDPKHSEAAADAHYRVILSEAKQRHILLNDQAETSGRARVEARQDYENSLRRSVPIVEKAGRWVIETALAMAEMLANQQGYFTETLRCDFTCRLSKGAIDVEERKQNAADVEAGLMPQEYAMSEAGIDDVDAALALINSRPETQLDVLKARAEVFEIFINSGLDFETAGELAGFDDEEMALIRKSDPTKNPKNQPVGDDPNADIEDEDVPEPAAAD